MRLQPTLVAGSGGGVEALGFVVEAAGAHEGAIVGSFAADEEWRQAVGGKWYTLRRPAMQSLSTQARLAWTQVSFHRRYVRAFATDLRECVAHHASARVRRSYGAPRIVAAIRPPGCSNASAAAGTEVLGDFGSGGADWAAAAASAAAAAGRRVLPGVAERGAGAVLSFFEASYQQRDRNLLIFLGMLALIFYIVNMMVHRQLHRVDEAVARRRSNEEKDPDHEEALAQLAEPEPEDISMRTDDGAHHAALQRATFERYRQLIAKEVSGAVLVPDEEIPSSSLSWVAIRRSLAATARRRLPQRWALDRYLERWSQPDHGAPEWGPVHRRYKLAINFIRYSQQHRNILTVCALRKGRRLWLHDPTSSYRRACTAPSSS